MTFDEFQKLARSTDQRRKNDDLNQLIPLLGVIGELGSVVSEYKKRIRDGDSYKNYKNKLHEELGDVLWYLANICTDMDLSFNDIAIQNLQKTTERWRKIKNFLRTDHYDEEYPKPEQFPRLMTVTFRTHENGKVSMIYDGADLGDKLTDNAYEDDGYRFHDAIHLAFMSILGWSPVIRKLLGRKRKSESKVDEVEDGARAAIIEEAISILIYDYARHHDFFKDIGNVDYEFLSTLKKLVMHLEVKDASTSSWEKAILDGYQVFRQLRENEGGVVECNLQTRTIKYTKN